MRNLCYYTSIVLLLLLPAQSFSQTTCGQNILHEKLLQTNPEYKQKHLETEAQLYKAMSRVLSYSSKNPPTNEVLPVVVHVIHDNGPENISPALINDGIQHLNDAFSNLGAYTSNTGTNVGIQFCLARRDPDGNATTGINRVLFPQYVNIDMNDNSGPIMKASTQWDPLEYINIWVVRDIVNGSVAGYATLPSAHGLVLDGIVLEYNFFGGTPENSVTLIHEMGHYLGLFHTFEGGCFNDNCLEDGDRICDTPPDNTNSPADLCPGTVQDLSCNGDGQNDLDDNFMDYKTPVCQINFTPQQGVRMCQVISNTLLSPIDPALGPRHSLLESIACLDPCTSPFSVALNLPTEIVVGDNFQFTTTPFNPSWELEWEINGQTHTGIPSIIFENADVGLVNISLTVTSLTDPNCIEFLNTSVNVVCDFDAEVTVSPASIGINQTVTLSVVNDPSLSYEWFNGAVSQVGSSVDFTFTEEGLYPIVLEVTGNSGASGLPCTFSITEFVQVGTCNTSSGFKWYFGRKAGLDFDNIVGGVPTQLLDGMLTANEGCASIADEDGDLLFYTNGLNVRNANHAIMTNGQNINNTGVLSSTQGALILPDPGNITDGRNRFYILTTMAVDGATHIASYAIVDMDTEALIDLDPPNLEYTLPIPLSATGDLTSERLAAVKQCNNLDYWIVMHGRSNANYYVVSLDDGGLTFNNTFENVGYPQNVPVTLQNAPAENGYLKFSPDGTRLACASRGYNGNQGSQDPRVELFDFDIVDGTISNPIVFENGNTSSIYKGAYGIEFSPSSDLLYLTCDPDNGNFDASALFQFDLTQIQNFSTQQQIANARVLIAESEPGERFRALQLGPDGNIYMTNNRGFAGEINRIEEPNSLGAACNYVDNVIDFPNSANHVRHGLPNFAPDQVLNEVIIDGDQVVCSSNSGVYSFNLPPCHAIATWSIVSGPAAIVGTNDEVSVELAFTGVGTVQLQLDVAFGCSFQTLVYDIVVNNLAPLSLPPVVSICGASCATLDAGAGYTSYLWSNGSTNQTICVDVPGTYSVSTECGFASTEVIQQSGIIVTATSNSVICNVGGQTGSITTTVAGGVAPYTYLWNNGAGTNANPVNLGAGTYVVNVTDANGCSTSTSVVIRELEALGGSVVLKSKISCNGGNNGSATANGTGGMPPYFYQWDNGETTATAIQLDAGPHDVIITDFNGCTATLSIVILEPSALVVATNVVTPISFYNALGSASAAPNGGSAPYSYSWDNGEIAQTAINLTAGIHTVVVTDANSCTATAQVDIPEQVAVLPVIYLEGPYSIATGKMNNNLRQQNLVPVDQPYGAAPWNYPGLEQLIPNHFWDATLVDWVLVELRDPNNPADIVDTQVGIMNENGIIVSATSTNEPILIFDAPPGSYHLVIKHRNHLPVMTLNPRTYGIWPAWLDMFNPSVVQTIGMHEIDPGRGRWGLIEGDVTRDYQITAADMSQVWNDKNQSGYLDSDSNMDGTCNALDRANIWNNINTVSPVP